MKAKNKQRISNEYNFDYNDALLHTDLCDNNRLGSGALMEHNLFLTKRVLMIDEECETEDIINLMIRSESQDIRTVLAIELKKRIEEMEHIIDMFDQGDQQ